MASASEMLVTGITNKADQAVDVIVDHTQWCETLTEAKAKEEVHTMYDGVEESYFKLGGALNKIQENSSWWEGESKFKDYVNNHLDIQYRKAMYLIGNYIALTSAKIEWDEVKHLGWTKLKEISSYLSNDNCPLTNEQLIEKAGEMSRNELVNYLRSLNKGATPEEALEEALNPTTMTVKFHNDQIDLVVTAIDDVKSKNGFKENSQAIYLMAQSWLNGGQDMEVEIKADSLTPETLKPALESMGREAAIKMVNDLWPEVEEKEVGLDALQASLFEADPAEGES